MRLFKALCCRRVVRRRRCREDLRGQCACHVSDQMEPSSRNVVKPQTCQHLGPHGCHSEILRSKQVLDMMHFFGIAR